MTDNRYDEYAQMEADMEDIYGHEEPNYDELDAMYVEHVLHTVKNGYFHWTLNDWIEVRDQIASMGRIREGSLSPENLHEAEVDFKETMDLLGYNAKSRLTPAEWVDRQGIAAGRREGRSWESAVNEDYSVDPDLKPVTDIKELPFDEMVAFRVARNEPWTQADTDLLNSRICKEWDDLNSVVDAQRKDNDRRLLDMDNAEMLRGRDGIHGDEPNISWYEAKRHGFGEDRATIQKEHDKRAESLDRIYDSLCEDLFSRVYATSMTRMDALPKTVRGDYDVRIPLVRPKTDKYLGSDYTLYYSKQIREYGDETAFAAKSRSVFGVDFSLHGTGSGIAIEPQNERAKMFARSRKQISAQKKADVNRSRDVPHEWNEMLNSVENGVSNPDYDFDEYDD